MNKQLNKHQKKGHYVEVFLADNKGHELITFSGIILAHNAKFVQMIDFTDLIYDGYVVFRKSDISEIRCSNKEKFIKKILNKERILQQALIKCDPIGLTTMKKMLQAIKKSGKAIILERLYQKGNVFQIGPIHSTAKKVVRINYFNSEGIYELKPVVSKYKEITYFRVDDNYSNLYSKYAKHIN